MAFSTWVWSKLTGTDIDEVQQQVDAADATLNQMNSQDYAPGGRIYNKIAASQGTQAANKAWQQVQHNLSVNPTGDITEQVSGEFSATLASETKDIGNFGSGFINGVLKNVFNVIPWQVWIVAAVALFIYFGGVDHVKKHFKK